VRRPTLTASVALVCVIALAACTTGSGDAVTPGATPSAGDAIARLTSTGGDVFSWTQPVRGEGACASVDALIDGEIADLPVDLADGAFTFEVPISPGEQQVAARCTRDDGSTVDTDPIALTGMLAPRPTARIDVKVAGSTVLLDGRASERAEPDGAAVVGYRWEPHTQIGGEAPDLRSEGGRRPFDGPTQGRRLAVEVPAEDGEYYVSLTVEDAEGRTDTSTTYFVVEGGRAREVDLEHEHPAWIDRSIVYAPVHQLWGGGAEAVEEWLPYLKELGADALWLWPPVTTRAPGEQYAIADYFTIDPEWGTADDMKRLIDRAHELGLRVLFDFVPNHSSIEHRYYQTADAEGEGSHYWDFYDRDENGDFTHYFDWEHLPNLNYDEPQVRRMMTEAFAYWIREFDVDGFRVDAAWGILRRRPDYWPEWRAELKRIKPDLLLLAEATARKAYYFENGFDVGYDWTSHPGQWAWASVWEFPQEAGSLLEPALTNQGKGYPRDAVVMRFLNNNDTDVRFAHKYDPDLTRVASALQFTVPGIPLLFAGDEIGANYQPYSNLTKIPWKDQFDLRPWYDSLIRLRDQLPAIRSREMQMLTTDASSVLSYIRPAAGGSEPVLVVLNFWKETPATIARDPALDAFLEHGPFVDAITGKPIQLPANGEVTLRMPDSGVHVIVPAEGA
jgi:cyclomaltodextrinase